MIFNRDELQNVQESEQEHITSPVVRSSSPNHSVDVEGEFDAEMVKEFEKQCEQYGLTKEE